MATHSSTLALKIPWTEEPGRLQSMGSLRVGYDWATSLSLFTFMHWRRKWQPTPVFLPGDGGAWWAAIYGVTQSRTWLSDLAAVAYWTPTDLGAHLPMSCLFAFSYSSLCLHVFINIGLLPCQWLGHRLELLWYWMVCLGNKQWSFCHFWDWTQAIWTLVNYEGHSLSSKGFLPTILDTMVI